MELYRIEIKDLGGGSGWACSATLEYKWGAINNISYYPDINYFCSDWGQTSKHVKQMCKRAWRKEAQRRGIKLDLTRLK